MLDFLALELADVQSGTIVYSSNRFRDRVSVELMFDYRNSTEASVPYVLEVFQKNKDSDTMCVKRFADPFFGHPISFGIVHRYSAAWLRFQDVTWRTLPLCTDRRIKSCKGHINVFIQRDQCSLEILHLNCTRLSHFHVHATIGCKRKAAAHQNCVGVNHDESNHVAVD